MTPRFATRHWVNALSRRVAREGGFVTVLRHGDDGAGAVALVLRDRNGRQRVLSRTIGNRGESAWRVAAEQDASGAETIDEYLSRQSRYDPDLWVVELDIADPERFIDDPVLEG